MESVMSLLGNIFRDIDFNFDFFERIIEGGAGGFLNDRQFNILLDVSVQLRIDLGEFPSPFSQEERDAAQPPVLPGTPGVPQILIIPDPLPERVTQVMQDWFEFVASNNPTPFDPSGFDWAYQGYDPYTFLV
jgi:hypothetical protein